MFAKVEGIFASFMPSHIRRQVRELYTSTIILNFAMAMVTIFEPVFLFLFFQKNFGLAPSLSYLLLFYLAVYGAYLFTAPLGAKFAKKFGYEYSIAIGTIFTALFYFSLFAIGKSAWFLVPAIIFYVLWKMFYWPAYHANFSKFSVDGEQGREVGNLVVLEAIVYILGPLIGGLLIQYLGFKALFILSAIVMVLSNVPMLLTKERFKPVDFSYRQCFARLFSRKNLKYLLTYCGFGEEIIVLTVWPVFMYAIIGNFAELGIITAVATFATTAIFLYIGKLTDGASPRKLLRFGSVLYFFGWLFRVFTRSVWGVFMIDTYSRITKQAIAVPILAKTYRESGHGTEMEGVLVYEMGLIVGKIIAIILGLAIIAVFGASWDALFVLAGAMGLLYLIF